MLYVKYYQILLQFTLFGGPKYFIVKGVKRGMLFRVSVTIQLIENIYYNIPAHMQRFADQAKKQSRCYTISVHIAASADMQFPLVSEPEMTYREYRVHPRMQCADRGSNRDYAENTNPTRECSVQDEALTRTTRIIQSQPANAVCRQRL